MLLPRPSFRNPAQGLPGNTVLRSQPVLHQSHAGRRLRQVVVCSSASVQFSIKRQVAFGESHKLIGGHPSLGGWNPDNAPAMCWNDGDVWTLDLDLPSEEDLEFKCIKVAHGGVEWESGPNHKLKLPGSEKIAIGFEWGSNGKLSVNTDGASNLQDQQQPQEKEQAPPPPQQSDPQVSSGGSDRLDHQRWQGAGPTFMQSNEHSGDRAGQWVTEGLQGVALTLVKGDRDAGSWLRKLELTKQLLVDEKDGSLPDDNALAYAFIYLQLINTGAIPCVEGGGHYRPNKHAELARDIFRRLERLIGDRNTPASSALLARKIHPRLPSFSAEYTQSTPLTRIRDIAHRNDIPSDLKREIKHTLQNKLHRNAGPEDLVATEAMLERISHGGYSEDFVNEFRVFTGELRDFFNAASFADMLQGLRESLDDAGTRALDTFLGAKQKADGMGEGQGAATAIMEALHGLTTLRATLSAGLLSGLRNDAPDSAVTMRQRWRLCEIRAEEYMFVLLSRFLNQLDSQGGAEALAKAGDEAWRMPLGAAVLSVRHIGLSGWSQAECAALENELTAWQQAGKFQERDQALRLKASLERLQRITQVYTDTLLSLFPERATTLGKALGLEIERVQVFTEAEVRASMVFQLSKLAGLLLKASRLAIGDAAWDALVTGEAVGKLVEVQRIEPGALTQQQAGPVVLLVKEASGDEEVGAAGGDLKGVILCHSLPHLSHLGVRARQEKVVFVTCEDEETLQQDVHPLVGQQVIVRASGESVKIEAHSGTAAAEAEPSKAQPESGKASAAAGLSKTQKVKQAALVPLAQATVESCGSKAAKCAQLAGFAQQQSSFRTASGVCIPFGSMELALKGKDKEFKKLLKQLQEASLEGGALDEACRQMQELVRAVAPPASILSDAVDAFQKDATVIVRSSANVEDLAGMSGAGLYDSIPGIPASDPSALGKAVGAVWASLYTRRAVLSRRAAGVKQADASMAVLIQEQLTPDLSFVLHTTSPTSDDKDEVMAELAVGLGETLASGTRGSPWRLSANDTKGTVKTMAFANLSQAYASGHTGPTIDYSRQSLSLDDDKRKQVGLKLAEVGKQLEQEFDGPQDVEGVLIGDNVYLVQTRPQP
ncbi:hypothetical protein WJX74_002436 [Apatococcus lobatus]|uniref:CBM20 domain-containing protein n=1 Tax=Apatococcus lobatus TaxID=904363 RepID=A0AAW1SB41_9CHLO